MKNRLKRHMAARVAVAFATTSLLLAIPSGCATAPAGYGEEVSDPFEKVNRKIFGFNQGVDRFVTRPLAKGYKYITPDPIETGVHNFFVNLRAPVEATNALLQGKPAAAATNLGRFVTNSIVGIGGLIDVASMNGIERQQEDFGQTLAAWGVPSGPYIMLPFLGPGSVRGLGAAYAEAYGVPIYENGWSFHDTGVRDKLFVLRIIDLRAAFFGADEKVTEAYDPYAFLRSAYTQRRDYLIYDGDPPEEEYDDEEFEED